MSGLEIEIYAPCIDCKYPDFVAPVMKNGPYVASQTIRCSRACVCKDVLGEHPLDLRKASVNDGAESIFLGLTDSFVMRDVKASMEKSYNCSGKCVTTIRLVTEESVSHVRFCSLNECRPVLAKLYLSNE